MHALQVSIPPIENNFALIQEVEDPGKYFPYSCKKVKDDIDHMDQQIRQLAELQIFETGEEIDHLEYSLEYEELQRVAWAAEIANDDETLLHIADLMVKKQQSATLVTSLNDDVKN